MNIIKKNVNVLVTAVGNIGVGNQILNALRLSDLSLYIVGTDVSEFNIEKEKLDFFYKVPYANTTEYEQKIKEIIFKHNIQIIFVGCEQDYNYFLKNRQIYEKNGIFLAINSDEISKIGFNKYKTYKTLEKRCVKIPKYYKIDCTDDYKKINCFPIIIKPNINSASSRNVFIAFNSIEAKNFIQYMLGLGIDIIAQEYIGDYMSEHTIGITSDQNGNILGNIIIKRNFDSAITCKDVIIKDSKRYVISSGITQGEIIHNDSISKQAENIALLLNSKGSLNIQAMYVKDELLVIEIHPMITGSVYIKALSGYNEPVNIIKKEILREDVNYKYNDARIVRKLISELH